MARPYPTMNMPAPAPINPLGGFGDLLQLASAAEDMKYRRARRVGEEQQNASTKAVTDVLSKHKGNLAGAIGDLEQQGYWREANALRGKQHEIRKAQQDELASRLQATREGFETSTRYLQGLEAAPDDQKPAMWAAVRPRLVETLPGLSQYIPEPYDPKFVQSAIPLGLSAADAAKRRQEAVETLNKKFEQQGKQLDRDDAVLEALSTYLDVDGITGEEVEEALQSAEALYGASPAVRQRFGEIPAGPLPPDVHQGLLARIRAKEPDTPSSFDAAILAARTRGDQAEVERLLNLQARSAAGKRDPDQPAAGTSGPSLAQRGAAERWKQNALATAEERYRNEEITADELAAEKKRIQASYLEQIGWKPTTAATAPPAPKAAPKPKASDFKKTPLSGGSVSVVAPNGKTYTFPDQKQADAFIAAATK